MSIDKAELIRFRFPIQKLQFCYGAGIILPLRHLENNWNMWPGSGIPSFGIHSNSE